MVKKTHLAIIVIVVIAVVGVSLAVIAYSKPSSEQFVKITINGLEENYDIDEPIEFSATIEGYGQPCGAITALIYGIDRSNFTAGPWADIPNCSSDQKNTSFTHMFPLTQDSVTTSLNQTGKYKLVVSFEELPSHKRTLAEQEFAIMP